MRGWTAQVHGKETIGILQAPMLEACEGMRGWIARNASKHKTWSAGAWTGNQGQQAPAGGL